jgi:hypothetical protein
VADLGNITGPNIIIPHWEMRIRSNKIVMKEPHIRQTEDLSLMQCDHLSRRWIRAIGEILTPERQTDAVFT